MMEATIGRFPSDFYERVWYVFDELTTVIRVPSISIEVAKLDTRMNRVLGVLRG
jgi:hypothetical protein